MEPTPHQKYHGSQARAREQKDRESQGRETLVVFPTAHEATPLQDGEAMDPHEQRRGADRQSTARSGSISRRLDPCANPLRAEHGRLVALAFLGGTCDRLGDSCGSPAPPQCDAAAVFIAVAGPIRALRRDAPEMALLPYPAAPAVPTPERR